MKKLMLCSAMLVSSVAMADTYQLNYGWTAPAWIPSDTPSYVTTSDRYIAGLVAFELP